VDTLHGLTLFCIFAAVACSVYSLKLIKAGKGLQATSFDRVSAFSLLTVYIILNLFSIIRAYY
jgi:hypothetical protein